MAISPKRKRLLDAYRFTSFRPLEKIRGIFGDPKARVITLVRRSKKRCAAYVGQRIGVGTIARFAARAICPTGTRASTSNSRCGGSIAEVVAR